MRYNINYFYLFQILRKLKGEDPVIKPDDVSSFLGHLSRRPMRFKLVHYILTFEESLQDARTQHPLYVLSFSHII